LKFEKSNLIHIQTNDNLVILTHKTDTLTTLTTFLKKCEKNKGGLHIGTEGVISFERIVSISFRMIVNLYLYMPASHEHWKKHTCFRVLFHQ